MKNAFLLLLIVILLMGCNKGTPTGTTTTTLPDSTFAVKLDTFHYYILHDTLNIYSWYRVPIPGNASTLDTVLNAKADTMVFHLYFSNGKSIHYFQSISQGTWDGATAMVTGLISVQSGGNTIVVSDSSTTIDSLIVFYSYWRQLVKYGPYRNKHRNPPIEKFFKKI